MFASMSQPLSKPMLPTSHAPGLRFRVCTFVRRVLFFAPLAKVSVPPRVLQMCKPEQTWFNSKKYNSEQKNTLDSHKLFASVSQILSKPMPLHHAPQSLHPAPRSMGLEVCAMCSVVVVRFVFNIAKKPLTSHAKVYWRTLPPRVAQQ